MQTLAARIHAFGEAADVLRLDTLDLPDLQPGELRLEMLAAPINPADGNIFAGTYGELPEPPAVIGNEGVGRVIALGGGIEGFSIGDLVATIALGSWCQRRNIPADRVIKLPPGIDVAQAAMLAINPPSAHAMLTEFERLAPGDWLVQNAANSGVGRSTIQIARRLGLRTLNVVRRPELIDELKSLGAGVVVTEETSLREQTRTLTGGAEPRLGLNSVGGASALNVAGALAPGGTLVTYGAMSRQPLKIPNGLLIFRDLSFRGFWLRRWLANTPTAERARVFDLLTGMMRDGALHVPVAATFPLREIHAALAAAAGERRPGKILLDLQS